MKDPQVVADAVRVTDLILSCVASGALGYAILLFALAYRRQLRPDSNLWAVVFFVLSYELFLLAGVASDIQRVHSPLTPYLPLHLSGTVLAIPAMMIGARTERRRLRAVASRLARNR